MDAFADSPLVRYESYWNWLDKKIGESQAPMAILQRRTMNTVCVVLEGIRGIPFSKLSSSLYFFCADVESREFTRLYESQLELAGAAPEKFAKGLHKFYNEVSSKIKKNDLYEDFFDFVSLCAKMRMEISNPNIDITVINCYYSMLLQNLDYLRPNKFDFNVILCGRKTNGELLTIRDCYPYFDVPAHTIEYAVRRKKVQNKNQLLAMVAREYSKAGYDEVKTPDDVDKHGNIDRVYTNQIAALLPFTNEYTYDLLPKAPYNAYEYPFRNVHVAVPAEDLIEKLHHRNRTLPTNGVVFKFQDTFLFREAQMKETFYNGSIYMLYRVDTVLGELAGYYDTHDGIFFSILSDAEGRVAYRHFRNLLLYLYACVVTGEGPKLQLSMAENCWYEEIASGSTRTPIQADAFGLGGKLKNVFDGDEETEYHALRKGNEKYTEEERAIQGYIRRVGKGRKPSEEAVAYAESLGYELAPDETYVRPFIRRVLRLKEAKNIENA